MKPPGLRALALTLTLAYALLPATSAVLEKELEKDAAKSTENDETGLVSRHGEVANVATDNDSGNLDSFEVEADSEAGTSTGTSTDTKAGRRRRRRGKTGGSKKSRRRRRRRRRSTGVSKTRRRRRRSGVSKTRRRRRSTGGGTGPAPAPPPPAATIADAKPRKIEAGWGDMAKMGEFFTLFIQGSGLDPKKDRAMVIHGDHTCGSGSARIATTLGSGDVPSGLSGWKSLKCDGLTSGPSKLACGNGEKGGDGVMFPDDTWVDTYKFKVCVCDYSKKNRCSSKADFDVTPTSPTLTVNPVV